MMAVVRAGDWLGVLGEGEGATVEASAWRCIAASTVHIMFCCVVGYYVARPPTIVCIIVSVCDLCVLFTSLPVVVQWQTDL